MNRHYDKEHYLELVDKIRAAVPDIAPVSYTHLDVYKRQPITPRGQIIFGICCGIFTGLFRCFGANAEGVSFAIILSNLLVPMIEKYTVPNAFGVVKTKPEKEAK